jgi:hypothetical protein
VNCQVAGFIYTAGSTSTAKVMKTVAFKGNVSALAATCVKTPGEPALHRPWQDRTACGPGSDSPGPFALTQRPLAAGCVAFDTTGALKSSADSKSLKALAKGASACNGLYVSTNANALLKRLFGNPQTQVKRTALAASSKAAAKKAEEVKKLAKSFKAAGSGQKKLDASRLFQVASSTAKAAAAAVSVALVVPGEWDSRNSSMTGACLWRSWSVTRLLCGLLASGYIRAV